MPAKVTPKELYKPTVMPDRIVLTWSQDPTTTQSITWRTDTSVKTAQVQFSPSEDGPFFRGRAASKSKDPTKEPDRLPLPDRSSTILATSTRLVTDLGEAAYHSVTLTGLTPEGQYLYRVGDGANWSEWFQFQTRSKSGKPLRFVYFGDAQNDIKEHWSRVVRGAYSDMPKADFLLHAGDLVNNGTNDSQWGEWHGAASWINAMVPCVPIPGNHEYNGKPAGLTPHWRSQFTLPEDGPAALSETVYYYDIQGVRMVMLNSNEKIADQTAWLHTILANNPQRWTVVTFHHPIYSTAKGRDNKSLREAWRPIFDQYGVDLVLTGHDHSYGRSGLMREDNLVNGLTVREKGTVYCVSVSGPKQYVLGEGTWMKSKGQDTQLYQLITIDGDKLHYAAHTATGRLYDEFQLQKRADGSNEMIERDQPAKPPESSRWEWIIAIVAIVSILAVTLIVIIKRRKRG
ncbi:MAG: fibronectin type III domain-containing protein [Fimbriiglobus sp.]